MDSTLIIIIIMVTMATKSPYNFTKITLASAMPHENYTDNCNFNKISELINFYQFT